MGAFIALFALIGQAHAAATLLPNGEQCFSATAPTSGGLFGPISTLGSITGGSGYVSATYTNVPLTGGSGFGALATITVTGGAVASVTVTNPGSHYAGADTLSAAAANLGGSGSSFSVPVAAVSTTGTGFVGLLGPITGGTGGTAGTYGGVALTGGSGSGATANITVSGGGAVTTVTILNPGTGYQVADTLSAASGNIGGTSGFSVSVSSVSINQALAGGSVGFFIPNTNTLKQTWQNAQQTILNTNPVTLDQNGCATIYGTGSYRQVLQDASANVVWDKVTTDTSAQQNVFWAGNATGTPNAITLTDPGFNGTDGSIINFFPVSTNTSAATISIASSSFTSISVVKDTSGGPVALTGGEIVQSGTANVVSVIYSAVQNNFHLLNTAIASASGASTPFCGAIGLKITNGSGTPSSVIALTADQVVMQTAAGLVINRSNVLLTNINITTGNATPTANGMDGEAPGTSGWLYAWAIDNGAAPAGLVSLASGNGTSPTLPSGYTYKCRLGAMRVDGSGNLLRTIQLGSETQYQVTAASNTTAWPNIANGTAGTFANTSSPTWSSVSTANFAPPTATKLKVVLDNDWNNGTLANVQLAPANSNLSGAGTTNPPMAQIDSGAARTVTVQYLLETANVVWASSQTGGAISAAGWTDKVNAN